MAWGSAPPQLLGLLLGASAIAAGSALVAYDHFVSPPIGEGGLVAVAVLGPDGEFFNGSVVAATALEALQEAGREGNFSVEVSVYPHGRYVWSVAGHAAQGECGWLYAVNGVHPSVASDRYAVGEGDRVWWHWGCAEPLWPQAGAAA